MACADIKRPTIGFLIDWLGGRYQSKVWPGVVAAAEERDANLIIFSGRSLSHPQGHLSQSNTVYDVISRANVDGLVILSGAISDYVSRDEFRSFIRRFHPLPLVSISVEVEKVPSVLIDNRAGISAVVSHFIEVHGYRRIAFIGGPEVNDEALQRFSAYQDELARHGIPFDLNLIAPGDFSEIAGIEAVRLLLDDRHIMPDAIVAVDDDTAIGALNELQSRGFNVPGDIAVAGFDDIDAAKFTSPALTSVFQPFFAQSHLAASMLLDYLDGKTIPPKVLLPTQIVIRQSCGCLPETVRLAGMTLKQAEDKHHNEISIEQVVEGVRDAIEQNSFRQGREKAGEWAKQLVHNFYLDLNEQGSDNFIKVLVQILQDRAIQEDEIGKWQNVISAMRVAILSYEPQWIGDNRAESLWGQARVLIGEAMERIMGHQLLQVRNRSLIRTEVERSVLTTHEFEELKSIAAQMLPALGIDSGYIVMSEAERYNPASIILAFNETGVLADGNLVKYNPLVTIVPLELLPLSRRFTMVMEALYFRTEPLGFVLFEMNRQREGIIYSELRQQLSSALKGALLLSQYKQAEEETRSKNKELEVFSYSVSHDLKAPLRAISQLSSWIVEDYSQVLDTEGQKKLDILIDRAKHMHDLIEGILQYSKIGRGTEKVTNVDLNKKINEIIDLLAPPDSIHIVIDKPLPVVVVEPTFVTQIFQNLLGNAIHYIDKPEGFIKIEFMERNNEWVFSVADNGPGIEEKYHEKIFQMFQTLSMRKDADSTGIGLALVKRIVEKWGGSVWLESTIGQGTTFYFTIPINGGGYERKQTGSLGRG